MDLISFSTKHIHLCIYPTQQHIQSMSENEDKAPSLATFASIIPQIFFDIIAWLIPGLVVIPVLVLSAVGSTTLSLALNDLDFEHYPPLTMIIVMALVLSYTISQLLNALWEFLLDWPYNKIVGWFIAASDLDLEYEYRRIKHLCLDAGHIILKVKARKINARILSVGLLTAFAITFFTAPDPLKNTLRIVLAISIFAALVAQHISNVNERDLIEDYYKILKLV
jgi:hypothetical protein